MRVATRCCHHTAEQAHCELPHVAAIVHSTLQARCELPPLPPSSSRLGTRDASCHSLPPSSVQLSTPYASCHSLQKSSEWACAQPVLDEIAETTGRHIARSRHSCWSPQIINLLLSSRPTPSPQTTHLRKTLQRSPRGATRVQTRLSKPNASCHSRPNQAEQAKCEFPLASNPRRANPLRAATRAEQD